MIYSKEILDEIADLYKTNGIVTRNECLSIDGRPFGRGLESEMKKLGYNDAEYTEANLDGFKDYSGVLYNSKIYSITEAQKYLIKNVLK